LSFTIQRDLRKTQPKRFAVEDKQARRAAKKKLLLAVVAWIEQNEDLAEEDFSESAAEVIGMLREFERSLGPASGLL